MLRDSTAFSGFSVGDIQKAFVARPLLWPLRSGDSILVNTPL